MKTLIAPLLAPVLALVISAPLAWAEPEETPVEEQIEVALQEEESQKSSKDEKIDRLFDRLTKKLEEEESDLTEEEREELREGLYDAKEALKELDEINIRVGSDGDTPFMGMLIGLVAVILSLGAPVIIVAIALYSSFKKRRLTHETINNYVSAGKDIPTEVLQGLQRQQDPKSNLHKGLVMVAVGLGIISFFLIAGGDEAIGLGLIPLFIGLAQLLVWKLESKNSGLEH
ncbi:hypothetical protein KFE80_01535 [bacterium SCSIO 12696]|nr:hypothetical protein KFE80_01535 [bacterium SCSIO 12696]